MIPPPASPATAARRRRCRREPAKERRTSCRRGSVRNRGRVIAMPVSASRRGIVLDCRGVKVGKNVDVQVKGPSPGRSGEPWPLRIVGYQEERLARVAADMPSEFGRRRTAMREVRQGRRRKIEIRRPGLDRAGEIGGTSHPAEPPAGHAVVFRERVDHDRIRHPLARAVCAALEVMRGDYRQKPAGCRGSRHQAQSRARRRRDPSCRSGWPGWRRSAAKVGAVRREGRVRWPPARLADLDQKLAQSPKRAVRMLRKRKPGGGQCDPVARSKRRRKASWNRRRAVVTTISGRIDGDPVCAFWSCAADAWRRRARVTEAVV